MAGINRGWAVGLQWADLGEWQRWERLDEQRQQLVHQIAERRQQLSQLPPLAELEQRLGQQVLIVPDEPGTWGLSSISLGAAATFPAGETSPAKDKGTARFRGLLRLLEALPSTRRIGQMKIERQPEGLITQLTLICSEEAVDE